MVNRNPLENFARIGDNLALLWITALGIDRALPRRHAIINKVSEVRLGIVRLRCDEFIVLRRTNPIADQPTMFLEARGQLGGEDTVIDDPVAASSGSIHFYRSP